MTVLDRIREQVADAIRPNKYGFRGEGATIELPAETFEDFARDAYRNMAEPDDPNVKRDEFSPFAEWLSDLSDVVALNTDATADRIQRVEIDVNDGIGRVFYTGQDTGNGGGECTCTGMDACDACGGECDE